MKVNNWTDRGIRYIRFGVATDEPHWKRVGLSFLRRAQAEAASPLLHVAKKISEQLSFDQIITLLPVLALDGWDIWPPKFQGEMISFLERRRNPNLLASS
jgi:hypothetical protein